MTDVNAGSPEPKAYDVDLNDDIRAAFTEVATKTEAPAVEEKPVKEPAETEQQKADRARDELGRFAKSDEKAETKAEAPAKVEPKPEPAKEAQPAPKAETPAPVTSGEQPAQAVSGGPPRAWSVKSKSEWEKLPEHFRADIIKREQDAESGFAKYEGLRDLTPYVEMARQSGTTIKQALDRYVGMENFIRQDPIKGILHVAQNAGISPQRLAMELAPYAGTSSPGQDAPLGTQSGVDPNLMQQWFNPLSQKISTLESLLYQQQQAEQARQQTAIQSVMDRFVADPAHRYYQNVEPQMLKLLEGGVVPRTGDYAADLKSAYDMACRMHPEISEALLNERLAKTEADRLQKEKEAAEKARLASRSIAGSPAVGAKDNPDSGGDSIEDDVRRAFRAHAA